MCDNPGLFITAIQRASLPLQSKFPVEPAHNTNNVTTIHGNIVNFLKIFETHV